MGRAREGRLGRGAIPLAPAAHEIARNVVVDQRRTRRERLRRGDDRGQDLIVDGEGLRSVACLFQRFGHDHGHDVADMPDLADWHGKVGGLTVAVPGLVLELADGRQVPHLVGHEIRGREDCGDARKGQCGILVDACDMGMRMR